MTPDAAARCDRIAAGQMGVIARWQATRSGMSSRMIGARTRSGEWVILYPGVYLLRGNPITWQARLLGACLWAGTGAAASHTSAAALWGLQGFRPNAIELSSPRKASTKGVIAHRAKVAPHHHTRIGRVPVTTVEVTLLDLCGTLPFEPMGSVLRDALRRKKTSLQRLRRLIEDESVANRPGIGILRRMVDGCDGGEAVRESELEEFFYALMRRERLSPVPQVVVSDRGRFIARADFAFPELKIAIELDGRTTHGNDVTFDDDRRKSDEMTALGWSVLRFTWRQTKNEPDWVRSVVRTVHDQRKREVG